MEDPLENSKILLKKVFVMAAAGITIIFKRKIHQKFAIIDKKTVWCGSINLLSFGYSEESVMRIVSAGIASELTGSVAIEKI